jgi:hypothetical protein
VLADRANVGACQVKAQADRAILAKVLADRVNVRACQVNVQADRAILAKVLADRVNDGATRVHVLGWMKQVQTTPGSGENVPPKRML